MRGHPRLPALSSAVLALAMPATVWAQDASPDARSFFDHPAESHWWFSGQINVIAQYHPSFPAAYDGPNSLSSHSEHATSFVASFYSGWRATSTTEIFLDLESAGGKGLSDAFGLGGFTNLDVVRNPTLGAAPYLARAEVHQVVPLSDRFVDADRGPLQTFPRLPERRLEFRLGKLSTVDAFDLNAVGSDSHFQFTNWTVDNDGAYDYAADTRGYTLGAIVEYQDVSWGIRFGEMLMPAVANGIDYDYALSQARAANLEAEFRFRLARRPGIVRLLAYLNRARMGSYQEAIDAFRDGADAAPDITAHREPGRTKHGFAIGGDQEVTDALRVFVRAGWNDGRNESFAYTEVDDTIAGGGDLRGTGWRRPGDRLGFAIVSNGLSELHRTYLALGGLGFLLGDGALSYGRETIVETYYTAHAVRGFFPAVDLQWVDHPGFNRARGPVIVGSARLHFEF